MFRMVCSNGATFFSAASWFTLGWGKTVQNIGHQGAHGSIVVGLDCVHLQIGKIVVDTVETAPPVPIVVGIESQAGCYSQFFSTQEQY